MTSKGKILITCKQMQVELPKYREGIEALGFQVLAPPLPGQQFSSEQLSKMSDGLVGMIAGDDQLDRDFFESAPDLRVLIRWGVGMDSVDHAAAADHQVTVRNTPGVFGREVADSAFAYVLMLARQHHNVDRLVRNGSWPKVEGITLGENQLGVVGMGAIGRQIAQRGAGFGMRVVGFDPFIEPGSFPAEVQSQDLMTLLTTSRFVVLACPYSPETHQLIGKAELEAMRSDAYLVNVARGPVVDESALVSALAAGQIAGAGLDVFEVEPLASDSPLREMPNVVLGAHNGSNTREGVITASAKAVQFLIEELSK
jgi:D-3-phosphoglycerate dehydrogenase